MNRREMLRASGLALIGLGLRPPDVCAFAGAVARGPLPPVDLAVVRASWDRVVATTVGLRPHRDDGFVLRAERRGDKTLIHNYGHGGAGMSLSWGVGAMAADLALAAPVRRAAVIGCGAVGLCAARQLQRRGFDVTIYAAAVPPDTTSNLSLASFTPTSVLIDEERRTLAWDQQFRQAATISYGELQQLADDPASGVSRIDHYTATNEPPHADAVATTDPVAPAARPPLETLLPDALRPSHRQEVLGPGEHPFPTLYAVRAAGLAIEPSIYLEALVREVISFGGRIVIRRFTSPRELLSLPEPVVINCTGLGARALFGDRLLIPVKGQLTSLLPQPEVSYHLSSRPADGWPVGMHPRRDAIVIGNLQERNNWSLTPNVDARERSLNAAIAFFAQMREPDSHTLEPTASAFATNVRLRVQRYCSRTGRDARESLNKSRVQRAAAAAVPPWRAPC